MHRFAILIAAIVAITCTVLAIRRIANPPQRSARTVTADDLPAVKFNISNVRQNQKVLDVAPWHSDGGAWTVFDCNFTTGPGVITVAINKPSANATCS